MAALKLPRSLHLLQGLILLLESKVHSGRPYWPRSAGVAVLAVRIDVPLTRADHTHWGLLRAPRLNLQPKALDLDRLVCWEVDSPRLQCERYSLYLKNQKSYGADAGKLWQPP